MCIWLETISKWKLSNLCPIFKAKQKFIKSNYRPVSLLSTLSKILEMFAFRTLYKFCKENGILTWRNSGFKEYDSTILQCLDITREIYDGLDKGQDVCFVYLDVSKAFDKVWHRGLLHKLKCIGVEGNLLKWFESYLTGRQQRVTLKGQCSNWYPVEAGVPQGSVLGPLLFLIFTNDIVDSISSKIHIFADDTCLYNTIHNDMSYQVIQQDLNKISDWGKRWLVTFNAEKTDCMIFSRKRKKLPNHALTLHKKTIKVVEKHKHLGIVFSNDLSWSKHVDYVIDKVSNRLNALKSIQCKVPRLCLENVYTSMILPILDYGDVLYDNLSLADEARLENVQRQAALSCLGAYRHTKHANLLKELGWQALVERRKYHRLIIWYKVVQNITPDYSRNLLATTVGSVTEYNLRNSDRYRCPTFRTAYCGKSFTPKTAKDWNQLPDNIKLLVKLEHFKHELKKLSDCKKKKYYTSCYGKHGINLTRIRLGLSALNYQRFRYHFISDASCPQCDFKREDECHFFLECPVYSAQRVILFTKLAPVFHILSLDSNTIESDKKVKNSILNLIVNGSEVLNYSLNVNVLRYSIEYIEHTARF